MAIIDSYRNILTVLAHFEMGAERADELMKLVQEFIPRIKECPGFISANFHLATDHSEIFNYAQWQTESAYLDFREGELFKEIEKAIKPFNPKIQTFKVVLAT
ncbi:MAG: hypothetical protein HN509_07075 [Halobacteriovoraceae bacterium]|jgi:quinol monooxygenase YgiN|nr:hypothetical protein [Halobacteriovoraceae bacterium]MBT5096091.1 hypothetical protein [Halobacteriovoraceae bacterium]